MTNTTIGFFFFACFFGGVCWMLFKELRHHRQSAAAEMKELRARLDALEQITNLEFCKNIVEVSPVPLQRVYEFSLLFKAKFLYRYRQRHTRRTHSSQSALWKFFRHPIDQN
jgi:hypothetical protein